MEGYDFTKLNPNCIALECLTLKKVIDGLSKNIPALDEKWAESKYFTIYEPPPSLKADGTFPLGAKENWLERMNFLQSDFNWLLSLEQFRFWSQLIFHGDSMNGVISFLQEGYPFYLLDELPFDNEIRECYVETLQIVFNFLLRLVTHSESKWEHITKSKLGDELYNSFIITLPMIYDICVIYGHKNRQEVAKFLKSLITLQPKYRDDIKKSVPYIFKVLSTIEEKFGYHSRLINGEPVKLSKLEQLKPEKTNSKTVRDLILHLLDSVATLDVFLDVYPPACLLYHSAGLEVKFASFYENVIPLINEKIQFLSDNGSSPEAVSDLKQKLDIVRFEMLRTFRQCITSCIYTARRYKSEARKSCEDFYNILSESLTGPIFTQDYHKMYVVDLDFDELTSLCPEIDATKREFIMQCVLSSFSNNTPDSSSEKKTKTVSISVLDQPSTSQSYQPNSSQNQNIAKDNSITHDKLCSAITEVKDILAHLGDGYIKVCLEHYNYQSSQVINAILESTLPEQCISLDPEMPWIPDDLDEPGQAFNESVIHENGDSEGFIGQKSKYRNFREMFNDKSHVHQMKGMYSKFGSVDTEGSLYDDEYDDTYDDTTFVPPDGETTGELRPFVTPRILIEHDKSRKQRVVEEEETDDDEEEKSDGPKPLDFCVNPEVQRARAAERWQSRRGGRGKPERNLVGKPKGQGQEKDVLKNRDYKSEHKGSHANHNRSALARRKKNMGMF